MCAIVNRAHTDRDWDLPWRLGSRNVESLPGSGSKFAWTLPLAREIPSEVLVDRDGIINECLPLASTQA
jgi:hypothetical protein